MVFFQHHTHTHTPTEHAGSNRALAEKDEHMKQWGEDVDALRAQLVAERRAWENDRTELEDIAADLEDELNDLKVDLFDLLACFSGYAVWESSSFYGTVAPCS